ncbi:MAG: redoxin domain-containing protein [Bacteroidales bacterium]|nr:redoxin domain-containing protein [Bacteroidales bacterium]
MRIIIHLAIISMLTVSACNNRATVSELIVPRILTQVRQHNFHPLGQNKEMTHDRDFETPGIADLDNDDWRIRLVAVSDLVRAGIESDHDIITGLSDSVEHVRQVCAMALGILKSKNAIAGLEEMVRGDENAVVRSQAVIALGQCESQGSLELLNDKLTGDPSRDVRHQCELAIDQIEKQMGTTENQINAFLSLDTSLFESVSEGGPAADFVLEDTEGKEWRLSEFKDSKWVVLIWVFADWCPVCHGEFHDLMKLQDEFSKEEVQVFTIECHDRYRARVMVGKELEPAYWFAQESFKEAYTEQIRWPHLLDPAGKIGAMYGADPLAFAVHSEYINRPTTVIIDTTGIVQFLYQGTYWGDRPTIEQTIDMIRNRDFEFEHPKRLK